MSGPFPGMDPYLEDASFWRGFHNNFIGKINDALNAMLPVGYTAYSEERIYVIYPLEYIVPDLFVVSRPDLPNKEKGTLFQSNVADAPILVTVPSLNVHERYIEIRTRSPRKVVTLLEVLSPANKAAGSSGREEYLRKQHSTLQSGTHLIEIDLLRAGKHTVAVPAEVLIEIGKKDYLVCLNRSEQRSDFLLWPMSVRDRLPHILIPLDEEQEDISLDLQSIFNAAYEFSSGRRDADYQSEPPVPLSSEDAHWMNALLRENGLRR